jgi:hypothetical protein
MLLRFSGNKVLRHYFRASAFQINDTFCECHLPDFVSLMTD